MGRHRKRDRPHKLNRGHRQGRDNRDGGYKIKPLENAMFDKYYKCQGIVPEGEWELFHKTLKSSLPVTFRITGTRSQAQELLKIIKGQYFSNLVGTKVDGKLIEPKCLHWYPDELAWEVDLSRKEIRHNDALKRLHEFLISETESGNISRQEAVSMLPPLLMDIKPHHKILDMCAAPGSKTAQLIEYLHADESVHIPEGFVVANDMDNKRCYLMVHQVKRINSPCCIIVNHDARTLPNLLTSTQGNTKEFVLYDRVLCDVPCSGDGTMRKNPDIWHKWNPHHAMNLHKIQKKILQRGLELLAPGGKLVYSTCSFNPVENEAVIISVLNKCEDAVELEDVSDKLKGLKFQKGISSWKVMSRDGHCYEKKEDAPVSFQKQWDDSVYSPSVEEATKRHLERCVRVLPHMQNTGGFFIALLHKKEEVPWIKARRAQQAEKTKAEVIDDQVDTENQDAESAKITVDTTLPISSESEISKTDIDNKNGNDQANGNTVGDSEEAETGNKSSQKRELESEDNENSRDSPLSKKQKMQGYKEDPFLFLRKDDPLWPSIKNFFKISDGFSEEQFMFRCEGGKKRTLYFVSKEIRNLVIQNRDRVKFVNMGVKALGRSPSPLVPDCEFRIAQEGLPALIPFISGRKVRLTREDIVTVLSQENPFISKLGDQAQAESSKLDPGSTIFYFQPTPSDPEPTCDILFCGWRGKTSVRSFVGKNERSHYLRLCGVELADIQKKVAEMKAARQAEGSNENSDVLDLDQELKDNIKSSNVDDIVDENDVELKDDVDENIDEEKEMAKI
ncbi:hypothetical protein ACJMK2_010684 [Sinanodonta woodiana]|uniref:tRNA (cytosine(34)-C(5))-methyltransferase n=1 Tax=Sinanodonta woodiana TaxID=1069815 RepID=A0ABD3VG68_SINWO